LAEGSNPASWVATAALNRVNAISSWAKTELSDEDADPVGLDYGCSRMLHRHVIVDAPRIQRS
jgi:hypothetical protein